MNEDDSSLDHVRHRCNVIQGTEGIVSGKHILVVDDEENILELVRYNLEKEGYTVTCAASGEDALAEVKKRAPDLIILDLMLPGIDGFEILRMLKRHARTVSIPILILSAKGDEADIVAGLELGADDYVTKPFSPKVLVARVRNVLRRRLRTPGTSRAAVKKIRSLEIDPSRRRVLVRGRAVELTATEFDLLSYLADSPGRVSTRRQLIDAVKGGDYPVTERSIDVQIAGLRKKLGPAGVNIETVHGVGYRFREER